MALAATGAECASAATPVSAVDAGHYRVEAKLVAESTSLSTIIVANHVLAILAVSHAIASPGTPSTQPVASAQAFTPFETSSVSFDFPAPIAASQVTHADARCLASIADANERQLLFVKITRG